MAAILSVDDSNTMRFVIDTVLTHAGHEVVQAGDGIEALGLARRREFQVVLTDIHMPGMDGYALIRELRALSAYRYVPIIALTATADSEERAAGRDAGATVWIVKPFSPDRLLGIVKQLVG